MSVQVHSELVQLLAGNAVIAKTPSQGGFHCLTLAQALMRRAALTRRLGATAPVRNAIRGLVTDKRRGARCIP
jgi:hypothetical protein